MADRFWVGDGGNWSDNTNHWSAASGDSPGASKPTSSDNVYFDANSFTAGSQTVTVNEEAFCNDMDWTGATNTPTFGGDSNLSIYGSTIFIAAMNTTHTGYLIFRTNAGQTLTTNGLTLTSYIQINFSGDITLQDDLIMTGTTSLRVLSGSLDLNDHNFTTYRLWLSGTSSRTMSLGSGTITITSSNANFGFDNDDITNETFDAETSTIICTNLARFDGGGETYNNVELNGTAHTISGSNTFATLTRNGTATKTDTVTITAGTTQTMTTCAMIGNSATNRLLMQSSTLGTAFTITATNWTGSTAVDIMDCTATNAVDLSGAATYTGDCGGNTNITFTTADTMYWHVDAGSWSDAGQWFLATNGGGGAGRVPLPQDDAVFDANSFDNGAQTVTADMPRWGKSINFTGVTNTPEISYAGTSFRFYGSMTFVSGMTTAAGVRSMVFAGRSSFAFTSGGLTLRNLYLYAPSGTLTLQDNLTTSVGNVLTDGTLTLNNKNLTCTRLVITGTGTRALNLGSGIITLNETAATSKWDATDTTGLTFDAGTSTIVCTNSGTNNQTFIGGGLTYNNLTIEGAGDYDTTISGDNTFNTLTIDRSEAAKTLTLTAGTEQTIANFVCALSGTTTLTIGSSAASAATITKSGGGRIRPTDYIVASYITGSPADTWFVGPRSTNNGNNTAVYFREEPKTCFHGMVV